MDEQVTLKAIRALVREEISESESRLRNEFKSGIRSEILLSEKRLKELMMSGFDTVFKRLDHFERRFEAIEHVIHA